MELDWYLDYWTNTTATIDYEVFSPLTNKITLNRKGKMPMPLEVIITYKDKSTELFYIPLTVMRGKKSIKATILKDWAWPKPTYTFSVTKPVVKIEIDKNHQTEDVDRKNNIWEQRLLK